MLRAPRPVRDYDFLNDSLMATMDAVKGAESKDLN